MKLVLLISSLILFGCDKKSEVEENTKTIETGEKIKTQVADKPKTDPKPMVSETKKESEEIIRDIRPEEIKNIPVERPRPKPEHTTVITEENDTDTSDLPIIDSAGGEKNEKKSKADELILEWVNCTIVQT